MTFRHSEDSAYPRPADPVVWRRLFEIALVAVAYVAAAQVGFIFASATRQVTAVWPPTGIALAAILLRGNRIWPGVFFGAFVGNAFNHEQLHTAFGIAAGNTLGPLLGAFYLERFTRFDRNFKRLRDVLNLALFGSVLAMTVTATCGVINLALAGIVRWSAVPSVWATWWIGDAMGVLLVAPPLLTWFANPRLGWSVAKLAECLTAAVALGVIGVLSLSARIPLAYPIFPPVIWFSLRFGPRETATAVLGVSIVALWLTAQGHGPFVSGGMDFRLGMLDSFMAVLSVTALALAALAAERRRADSSLRHANEQLETRVATRTAQLTQSEERFRGAFETAAHGFALLSPDGRWLRANAALCRMVGYTEEELLAIDFQTITHPDDLDADLAYVAALLAGEIETYQMEKRYFHKDGSIVWILLSVSLVRTADGSPLQFVSQITDITDRKKYEEALIASEEQYRILADHSTDAVFRLDLEGYCLYASPSSLDLIGFEPEYLQGRYLLTRFHPEDTEYVINMNRALVRGDMDRAVVAYRSEPADRPGSWIWLEANCGLVRDPVSKAPREIIASVRDISERKALELQLEEARRSAEEAAAARSTFLANMSHEIRTPMSGILGMIELLRSAPAASDEGPLLDGLEQSAQMLTTVLNDILDYSKLETEHLNLESVSLDFRSLMQSTFNLFAMSAANEERSLFFSFPKNLNAQVQGDPARLRQIVANLLSNAVKFTSEGRIELRVSLVDASVSKRRWRIEVADTGIGIGDDMIATIFSPFVQADASTRRHYGGTGLGLAICQRLVEAMKGEIGVESVLGAGSLFWFEVPLAKSAATASRDGLPAPDAHGVRVLDVLLAEDNPINRQLVEELVRRMGHEVTCVQDGRAAVEAYAARRFDLVLMDMQMPEMDGPEAAAAIRSLGGAARRVPIVALTADPSAVRNPLGQAARFDAFLTKPIDTAKLAAAIAGARPAIEGLARHADVDGVPVLDSGQLGSVAQTLGAARHDQLLTMLCADVTERSLAIKRMIECGDLSTARRNAHSLCGAALPFGAMKLADAARKLEMKKAELAPLAEELVQVARETVEAIGHYRQSRC